MIGGHALRVLFAIGALLALGGLWQPQDPFAIDLAAMHLPPGPGHWLGTDHLGRDMLARILLGAGHTALVLATVGVVSYVIGTAAGVVAATCGGAIGAGLIAAAEFLAIMPALVLGLIATALFGLSPLSAGVALGIAGAGPYALVAYGLAMRLRAMPFVRAAEALGVTRLGIAWTHVLPNCAATLRTYLASDAGRNVVHYAALTFLGLGADAASPDWGAMLYEYRVFVFDWPELMLWPGLAITLVALALNLVIEPAADGLRLGPWSGQARRTRAR